MDPCPFSMPGCGTRAKPNPLPGAGVLGRWQRHITVSPVPALAMLVPCIPLPLESTIIHHGGQGEARALHCPYSPCKTGVFSSASFRPGQTRPCHSWPSLG